MFRPAAASPPRVFNGVQTAEKLSRFAVRPTCPALFCLFYCHNCWDVFFFSLYPFVPRAKVSDPLSTNGALVQWLVGTVASTPLVSRCAKLKYSVSPLHGVAGFFFSLSLSLSPQSQQHTSFSRLNGPRGGSLGCTIPLVFFFSFFLFMVHRTRKAPRMRSFPTLPVFSRLRAASQRRGVVQGSGLQKTGSR